MRPGFVGREHVEEEEGNVEEGKGEEEGERGRWGGEVKPRLEREARGKSGRRAHKRKAERNIRDGPRGR